MTSSLLISFSIFHKEYFVGKMRLRSKFSLSKFYAPGAYNIKAQVSSLGVFFANEIKRTLVAYIDSKQVKELISAGHQWPMLINYYTRTTQNLISSWNDSGNYESLWIHIKTCLSASFWDCKRIHFSFYIYILIFDKRWGKICSPISEFLVKMFTVY